MDAPVLADGCSLYQVHYPCHDLDFSPDGSVIAVSTDGGLAFVIERETGEVLLQFEDRGTLTDGVEAFCVRFSHDGLRCASGSGQRTALVWDSCTGCVLHRFAEHEGDVRRLAWSHNDKRLATVSECDVRVWDTITGAALFALVGHRSSVCHVAFSPDDQRLASGGYDRTVRVWNMTDGKQIAVFEGHTALVGYVAFRGDNNSVLSVSLDDTARVWDVERLQQARQFPLNQVPFEFSACTTSEGACLMYTQLDESGSGHSIIGITDVASGKDLGNVRASDDLISVINVSRDGQWMVGGSQYGRVYVWPTPDIVRLEVAAATADGVCSP